MPKHLTVNDKAVADGVASLDSQGKLPLAQAPDAITNGTARRRACIDLVDCTAVPPTEVSGDRYILDFTAGTVNAAWDTGVKGDIVEFDGAAWIPTTPEEGWVSYLDTPNKDALYVDDGTPAWQIREVATVDAVGISYNNSTSGLAATDVQAAIDEVETRVDVNDAKVSNVTTNLGYTASPTDGTVTSSDGTDATLTLATGVNAGLLAPADFTTLSNTSGTNTGDEVAATESVQGIAEIATQAETDAGVDDTRFVTPVKLEGRLTNLNGSFATTLLVANFTTNGDGTTTATANHNFGTDDVLVEVYDPTTKETVLVDKIDRTDTNNVAITIQEPAADVRVVITQTAPVYQGVSGRNVVSNPATPYTAQNNDIILWDATAGNKVVTLPVAGSSNSFRIDIKKTDASVYTVTVDGNGATIDGGATAVLTLQYEAISIVCDGGSWHILASV
jgi:hypothetical protein